MKFLHRYAGPWLDIEIWTEIDDAYGIKAYRWQIYRKQDDMLITAGSSSTHITRCYRIWRALRILGRKGWV